MKIGTKSVLFGAHCFFLHPFFVAAGWTRLYGFPWDPRLWVVFFVHDLGYVGKPNMDGEEGESHPHLGASIMYRLFDPAPGGRRRPLAWVLDMVFGRGHRLWNSAGYWHGLCVRHSRFLARKYGVEPSRLCYADKLAIVLTPWWLYLPMAWASGELAEYMDPKHHEEGGKYETESHLYRAPPKEWYLNLQDFLRGWLEENGPATP